MKTSTAKAQPAMESPYDTVLRIGTGLMMAIAAALVLLHAEVYASGLPQPTTALWDMTGRTSGHVPERCRGLRQAAGVDFRMQENQGRRDGHHQASADAQHRIVRRLHGRLRLGCAGLHGAFPVMRIARCLTEAVASVCEGPHTSLGPRYSECGIRRARIDRVGKRNAPATSRKPANVYRNWARGFAP